MKKSFMKRNKLAVAIASGSVGAMGAVTTAHAALSTEIATGLTAIQTDGLALVDLLWPIVVAFTSAFIIFKLFKRGVRSL